MLMAMFTGHLFTVTACFDISISNAFIQSKRFASVNSSLNVVSMRSRPAYHPSLYHLPIPHTRIRFESRTTWRRPPSHPSLSHLSDSGEKRGEAELIMLFCGYATTEFSKIIKKIVSGCQKQLSTVSHPVFISLGSFLQLCHVHSLIPACNPFA